MLDRLGELCEKYPLREKIVVVPSLAIGHQIGDALARSGRPWINLRFETTRTIADAVVGLELAREGLTVLSRAQALALIERACDRVLDEDSYFASLRRSPGLHRAIQRSIDDLRLAGVGGHLTESAFEDSQKARDLERIVAAYEEELAARRLIDRCGVVKRAIERLEANGLRPWGSDAVWIAIDDVEAPHEESRLVALASRDAVRVRIAGTPDEGAAMPRLASLRVVRAVGEENEIRAALRSILHDAVRYDDAELIYAAPDPYLPLIFELCSEYEVEATHAEGVAVSFTAPGEACLAFLDWCGEGWNAVDLEVAARSGALRTGIESLAPSTLARVLRKAKIGWGFERHRAQLESLVAKYERELSDTEVSEAQRETLARGLEEARHALEWITRLAAIAQPVAASELICPSVLARAAEEFVAAFAATKSGIDAMATAALQRMFDELAQLPESELPIAEAATRLREAVLALYVGASNPRPRHLHVAPLRSAAWSGRRRLFLIGLGEAHFPGAGIQDPIVLDAERANLNREITPRQLALRGDTPLRAVERLRRCLARAPEAQWTVSYSSMTLREQREAFPSTELLEIYRTSHPAATMDDVGRAAEAAGFIDEQSPLSASEWWLSQRFVTRRAGYAELLRRQYPWLARGDEAETARASLELTRWDGLVQIDPAAIDPRLTRRILSASQIERMASCPYSWFLRHVLRIEPPDEFVRDPEVWLDPRNLGSLLHEVFENTMQSLCDRREQPNLNAHLDLMHEIARRTMDEWREDVPPPNEAAFLRQSHDILRTCETFLRIEQEACADSEAVYFELPFGFEDAEEHPAGMAAPLEIDLGAGKSVLLRGRIDRVDRTPDGRWRVWDYKTGGLYGWDGTWIFSGGKKVQHAIYERALAAALRARGIDEDPVIESSGYYFPTPKGGGERVVRTTQRGALEKVLNRAFDVIAAGFFAHPEDAGECRFCDFATVCGGADAAAERAAAKYEENAESRQVSLLRRLHEVE